MKTSQDKSILRTDKLNVIFSKKQVLSGVDLDFSHGQITAVIGPSGSGKSTLLRTLNRMIDLVPEAQVEGDVCFKGKSIFGAGVDVSAIRRSIGMVSQNSAVFRKSIFENIAYGLRIKGWTDPGMIEHQVTESLKKVHLWDSLADKLDLPAAALDRERQQRLYIARALVLSPEVLLIDEPTGDLDSGSTNRIEIVLRELRLDRTIIVATHSLHQAARISDKAAFLYFGRLVEYRDTQRFFTNPVMKLTEDYLTGRIFSDEG